MVQNGFSLFITLFNISIIINSIQFSWSYEIPVGTKLDLTPLHINRFRSTTSQLDRYKQFLHNDAVRLRSISQRANSKNVGVNIEASVVSYRTKVFQNVTVQLPLNSAADYGSGQFLVHFNVGSPAQKVSLIADTGSDLTWMNCRYRCRGRQCGRNVRVGSRIFRSDQSASFRTVACSSRACRVELSDLFSLARCRSPMDPCAFDYRYGDGSSTQGVFANETITFRQTNGRKRKLHKVLIGCSDSSSGRSFQTADGVMGLGHSNQSFAVKAATRFGGKFSYCLVDHLSTRNISSYLVFGPHVPKSINVRKMRYTKLVLGVIDPFYAVSVKSISVGGVNLNIPTGVFNVNSTGGTIIDSGSSLTSLTQPAYKPVMDALKLSLLNFRNLNLDIGPLEYCFNSTGFNESLVPRLMFHFLDGARFVPPVKSYVIDVAPGVKCLGIIPAASPGASVIGNIMQQNHLWEFDIVKGRLGFASSSCT